MLNPLNSLLQARKFDIIPTLTAIGSGVGIFGVVCESRTLYFLWHTLYLYCKKSAVVGDRGM